MDPIQDSGGSDSAWRGPWSPNKRCWRPNEVFKKCVSSSCAEMKCGMRNAPFICTADCQSGCFCRDGYYRNRWGQCVTAWQCKAYYPWNPWNPWNPWTPWNPYYPGFTTRPTTYPEIYGPEVYGLREVRHGCEKNVTPSVLCDSNIVLVHKGLKIYDQFTALR
ncbi:hypothetical protein MRX96_005011 [Rhipicephalus microplus]